MPERLAAALRPVGRGRPPSGRVPRLVLAGVVVLALAAGLVAVQEVSAAGEVRRGVRVGGVDLSGLTRTEATERLRAAAGPIQAAPLAATHAT